MKKTMMPLFLIGTCFPLMVQAQKVTFKKDEYQVDKQKIATVEEKRSENLVNKNFSILDNSNKELIQMKIQYNNGAPQGFVTPTWYDVTFVPLNRTVSRPLSEKLLGARKELLEEFAEMNVIGTDGLQKEGVDAYAAKYNRDLKTDAKNTVDSIRGMTAKGSFITERDKKGKIKITGDKLIFQSKVQIGLWEKYGDKSNFKYIIKNMQGGIVGMLVYVQGFGDKGVELYGFFGGDEHTFYGKEANISPSDSDNDMIEKFVSFMIGRNNM